MRWKAFFRAMFHWNPLRIYEFPLEMLVFSVGALGVIILIKWITGG